MLLHLFLANLKNPPVFMEELFPVVAAIIEKIENENPQCNNGILIFVPELTKFRNCKIIYLVISTDECYDKHSEIYKIEFNTINL